MRTTRRFLFALLLSVAIAAAETDFAVIASEDVPVSNLSMADLRKLFLGDRQFWGSSLRVALVMRAPVARERAMVVWTICRMSEAQFAQYWIGKVMRADCTTSPRQFSSNQAAMDMVRTLPGAIAIVNAAQVQSGMKVLPVEGKLPNQPGYKLRLSE
jgi:hypothetical protein